MSQPAGTTFEDTLLAGSIDLHAHVYPEISLRIPGRVDDLQWAQLAAASGMRGFVMKSQVLPTCDRAYFVQRAVPDVRVFGSVTLNHSVGGLNPVVVDITGELGGKVVWMPTWGARNDIAKRPQRIDAIAKYVPSVSGAVRGVEDGIAIGDGGGLKPVVRDIVEIARDHGMIIASGHVSVAECLLLVDHCARHGVPFVMTHAMHTCIGATLADQREIAARGGYVEHAFVSTMPMHQKLDLRLIVEAIEAVGPEHTVLSSDAINPWNPPAPEMLRMFIASLLSLGVPAAAITQMVRTNPVALLRLEEGCNQPAAADATHCAEHPFEC